MRSCLRTWKSSLTTLTTACRQAATTCLLLFDAAPCRLISFSCCIVSHRGHPRHVLMSRWTAMRCGCGAPLGSRRTNSRSTESTSRAPNALQMSLPSLAHAEHAQDMA